MGTPRVLRAKLPRLRRRELLTGQIRRAEADAQSRQDEPLQITAWQLAATGSADPDRLIQAATLAVYARDHERAAALLDAVPEHSQTFSTRLMHCRVLFELGRSEQAEKALSAAYAATETEQDVVAVAMARVYSLL